MNLAQLIMHALREHGADFRHFPEVDESGKPYNFKRIHDTYHNAMDWGHTHNQNGDMV